MARKPTTLARDSRNSIMQIGSYYTEGWELQPAGGATSPIEYDTYVRVVNYGTTTSWIMVDTVGTATAEEGMALLAGTEIHLIIPANNILSSTGGDLNIVPMGAEA